ncbi:hypothetical protein IQ277_06050 [Nostocales cyanobacterium LEGE 12452]|nr:hypothetical protein [Nostocales cyanobacterium LEGE 12452]
MTWKKYLPKNQDFCRIRKAEFFILDKVELRIITTGTKSQVETKLPTAIGDNFKLSLFCHSPGGRSL